MLVFPHIVPSLVSGMNLEYSNYYSQSILFDLIMRRGLAAWWFTSMNLHINQLMSEEKISLIFFSLAVLHRLPYRQSYKPVLFDVTFICEMVTVPYYKGEKRKKKKKSKPDHLT